MGSLQAQHVVLQSLLFRGPLDEIAFKALIQDCAGYNGNKSSSQYMLCLITSILTYRYVFSEVYGRALPVALKISLNLLVAVFCTLNATTAERENPFRSSISLSRSALERKFASVCKHTFIIDLGITYT